MNKAKDFGIYQKQEQIAGDYTDGFWYGNDLKDVVFYDRYSYQKVDRNGLYYVQDNLGGENLIKLNTKNLYDLIQTYYKTNNPDILNSIAQSLDKDNYNTGISFSKSQIAEIKQAVIDGDFAPVIGENENKPLTGNEKLGIWEERYLKHSDFFNENFKDDIYNNDLYLVNPGNKNKEIIPLVTKGINKIICEYKQFGETSGFKNFTNAFETNNFLGDRIDGHLDAPQYYNSIPFEEIYPLTQEIKDKFLEGSYLPNLYKVNHDKDLPNDFEIDKRVILTEVNEEFIKNAFPVVGFENKATVTHGYLPPKYINDNPKHPCGIEGYFLIVNDKEKQEEHFICEAKYNRDEHNHLSSHPMIQEHIAFMLDNINKNLKTIMLEEEKNKIAELACKYNDGPKYTLPVLGEQFPDNACSVSFKAYTGEQLNNSSFPNGISGYFLNITHDNKKTSHLIRESDFASIENLRRYSTPQKIRNEAESKIKFSDSGSEEISIDQSRQREKVRVKARAR